MIAMKFGGTSVGDIDAFAQVISIVDAAAKDQQQAERPGVVVITSAMSGVTNLLIEAAERAAAGDDEYHLEVAETLRSKHHSIAGRFVDEGAQRAALGRVIDERLEEFTRLCSSISVLGELTQRGLDLVSGLGERLNAPLLAAVLQASGVPAEAVDATELIVTDKVFGGAAPILSLTEANCREKLLPLMQKNVVPIVTGFVGATEDGIPTTLGRGGSDYSCALIGAALDVDEIQIWTDVNGVMTADPRIVPTARSLKSLSYEEVAELSYYGAKVIHPKTVTPALDKGIPIRVLNTFEPEHRGTEITSQSDSGSIGMVKAITAIPALNMVTVAGRGMIGVPGIAARTFGSVAQSKANVLMISQSSSEQSICFVVPDTAAEGVIQSLQQEFKTELERGYIDEVFGHPAISIIAVVGSGMRGTPGLAAGIFQAVATQKINVLAIAQGSSEANVSLIVQESDTAAAVNAIHSIFELDKPIRERTAGG